ncbi:fibrous sheath-interacting protein 1 isoform X5 [Xyrichtys novacula]|uniref:Fibrous sheath-interacting protein 1 n=1 Tax=Xyrichtys novacula TaxID=13765 RepID=A0AAV1GI87_XYRNO|nr:fibrous sheath-interacting protein 1 isoform X5 [Xyrichtys novacula]
MEITRGSLEDISRPASSEKTGSRVSSVSLPRNKRIGPAAPPLSLVVLSNDVTNTKMHSNSEYTITSPQARGLPDKGPFFTDLTNEEEDDPKLQRAIEEMKRLDEQLSEATRREKEAKHRRQKLLASLWQAFMRKPKDHSECAQEARITRLFLASEETFGREEVENSAPVFQTQIPDCDHTRDSKSAGRCEKMPDSWTESFEVGHEERREEQFEGSHYGDSKGKKKQKAFVKRNIELVGSEGAQVLLSQAEKKRLAELLREIEEEDNARGADSEEEMGAVSVPTGQGYTPEPSDHERLNDIDSKLRHFLPKEEFLSVQSSYTDIGRMSKDCGSQVGWMCDGDQQSGGKVLQDIKERRGQERRLQEIDQQLELLGLSQEMTIDSPDLSEEQILSLLNECELPERWIQDLERLTDPN